MLIFPATGYKGWMSIMGNNRGKIAVRTGAVLLLLASVLVFATSGTAADKYDFKLEEIRSGERLELADLTTDKALIFHIWSPECPHCQRHMPYVAGLHKKVDQETTNFYTCSMSENKQDAVDYLDGKGLDYPVFYGESGYLSGGLTSNGWPTTFVFAPGGKFIGWCDTQGPAYVTEVLELVDKALNQ